MDDYLRFARMLLNGGELDGVRIISAASIAEMTCDQLPLKVGGLPGHPATASITSAT